MNTEEWMNQTNELLEDLERQKEVLQDRCELLEKELQLLERHIASGHELIRAYMKRYNISSTTPRDIKLSGQSYPEMLIEIVKQSNGILSIDDASEILLKNNVGSKKQAIKRNIYSTLARMRNHFKRIATGQYRFTNHVESDKRRVKSGVTDAVKSLKEQNPFMTLKDIISRLKKDGFDFKGKKPSQSVNMAWVKLGYSKEGKQQRLPITNQHMPDLPTP